MQTRLYLGDISDVVVLSWKFLVTSTFLFCWLLSNFNFVWLTLIVPQNFSVNCNSLNFCFFCVLFGSFHFLWLYRYPGADTDDSDEDHGDDVISKQLVEDYAKKLEKTEDEKSSDDDNTLSSGNEESEDDDTATDNDQRPSSTYALNQLFIKWTILLIVHCIIIFLWLPLNFFGKICWSALKVLGQSFKKSYLTFVSLFIWIL